MAATSATLVLLSGSTNGRPIKVVATATAGTLIHTATSGSGDMDRIYLYAANTSAASVKLTLEWGGVTSPDDLLEFQIPSESGTRMVIDGAPLAGGLIVRAFAASANVINIIGRVIRVADNT